MIPMATFIVWAMAQTTSVITSSLLWETRYSMSPKLGDGINCCFIIGCGYNACGRTETLTPELAYDKLHYNIGLRKSKVFNPLCHRSEASPRRGPHFLPYIF